MRTQFFSSLQHDSVFITRIYFNLVYLFKMCVYQTSGVNIKSQCIYYNAEVREQQQKNTILLDFESGSFLCHIFTSFCLIIDISFFSRVFAINRKFLGESYWFGGPENACNSCYDVWLKKSRWCNIYCCQMLLALNTSPFSTADQNNAKQVYNLNNTTTTNNNDLCRFYFIWILHLFGST